MFPYNGSRGTTANEEVGNRDDVECQQHPRLEHKRSDHWGESQDVWYTTEKIAIPLNVLDLQRNI